ncbi:hypothetical protein ACQP3D_27480, partial [Escherichia coli]
VVGAFSLLSQLTSPCREKKNFFFQAQNPGDPGPELSEHKTVFLLSFIPVTYFYHFPLSPQN